MAKGPKWFQALPHWAQEAIEQTLHGVMGYFARLVAPLDLLLWDRERRQWPPGKTLYINRSADVDDAQVLDYPAEGYEPYAPHDRVWDLMVDTLAYQIGGTLADLTRGGLIIWWVVKLYSKIGFLIERIAELESLI